VRERVLVAHFLRRFLDNDLISPQADRHQVLAVIGAGLVTSGMFLTVLVSTKYLFKPLQSRGWTLVTSLDDTFLWSGLSLIVMALVALGSWDALSLDARDTAILGPLPIPRRTLVAAQFTALALFAGGFAVALNVIPGVLAPLIRVSRLPVGVAGVLRYVAAHLTVTFASGALGFVSVLTVREVLRAVLGPTLFQRASAPVQGGLVVLLATSLLLLPGQAAGVDGRWVSATEAFAMPPVWFVGLHETLAGDGLANVTATRVPADAPARMSLEAHEARMIGRYRVHQPILRQLGGVALRALAVVFAIAAVACAWNNRRLPHLTVPRAGGRGRFRAAGARLVHRALVPDPLGQAGFVFTLQTLARSVPHRVAVAVTCGAAFAAAAVSLNRTDMAGGAMETPPLAAFAMQTWVLVILVAGFRYATRVPADVRGTTTFVLARPRSDHAFLRREARGHYRSGVPGHPAAVPRPRGANGRPSRHRACALGCVDPRRAVGAVVRAGARPAVRGHLRGARERDRRRSGRSRRGPALRVGRRIVGARRAGGRRRRTLHRGRAHRVVGAPRGAEPPHADRPRDSRSRHGARRCHSGAGAERLNGV